MPTQTSDQQTQPPATPPPGLINTTTADGSTPVTGYNAAQATSTKAETTGYKPEDFGVGAKQTVAGQLKDIIAEGSPLMEQAEARARAQMNARGLINSSMAVGAGQSALYDTALPIATSDAATYDRAATNTTASRNQALQFEAGAKNTAGLQDAQLETNTSQFNAGQTNTALQSTATAATNTAITKMNNDSAQILQKLVNEGQLAAINRKGEWDAYITETTNKNKLLLQTSAGASQYYNTMLQYMATITTNPNMTKNQKATALNNAVTQLNDALGTMSTIAGIPGIESLLNFGDEDMGGVGGGGAGNISDTQGATGVTGFDPGQTGN